MVSERKRTEKRILPRRMCFRTRTRWSSTRRRTRSWRRWMICGARSGSIAGTIDASRRGSGLACSRARRNLDPRDAEVTHSEAWKGRQPHRSRPRWGWSTRRVAGWGRPDGRSSSGRATPWRPRPNPGGLAGVSVSLWASIRMRLASPSSRTTGQTLRKTLLTPRLEQEGWRDRRPVPHLLSRLRHHQQQPHRHLHRHLHREHRRLRLRRHRARVRRRRTR